MTSSPRKLRQIGDQGIGDAVGEIVLARIAAQIRERQHRDGGPLWREGLLPFKRQGEKADEQRPDSLPGSSGSAYRANMTDQPSSRHRPD